MRVKLSALQRIYQTGGLPEQIAVRTIVENSSNLREVSGQMDSWVKVNPDVVPLVEKLREKGLLLSSEVKE